MKQLLLIGGGGHCKSCIDVIEQTGLYEIAGIIEGTTEKVGQSVLGYPITGIDDHLPELRKEGYSALITAGHIKSVELRAKLAKILTELDFEMPIITAPTASVSKHAEISAGSIIMNNAFVNAGVKIGSNCIINNGAHLEHDAIVGDLTHVSTQTVVNGDVQIGSRCFIGSNSTVANGVIIPDNTFIKAGELVTQKSV